MHTLSRKIVSLLMMTIIFLTALGAYGFNSKWLAHELDHDRHWLDILVDHDHAPKLDAKGETDPAPLSDSEHQLVHAAGNLQALFNSSILDRFVESPARTTLMLSRLLALPPAEFEPALRPPRTACRL